MTPLEDDAGSEQVSLLDSGILQRVREPRFDVDPDELSTDSSLFLAASDILWLKSFRGEDNAVPLYLDICDVFQGRIFILTCMDVFCRGE